MTKRNLAIVVKKNLPDDPPSLIFPGLLNITPNANRPEVRTRGGALDLLIQKKTSHELSEVKVTNCLSPPSPTPSRSRFEVSLLVSFHQY